MAIQKYKFPKIFHLKNSKSLQNDDRMIPATKGMENGRVIVSEKIDGEGFTLSRDYLHARSLDSKDHLSRHWIKSLHAQIRKDIPDGWRICGENMFALHSIYYTGLPSYFIVFSIFNDNNDCLSWDDTVEWCSMLNLCHVPVLYDGKWDEEKINSCYTERSLYDGWQPKNGIDFDSFRMKIAENKEDITFFANSTQEGFVVRAAKSFSFENFQELYAKWVRKGHVQTSELWMLQPVIRNKLRTEK